VLPACQGFGLGVIPWSPLQGGILGGGLKKGVGLRRKNDWTKDERKKHAKALDAWEKLCAKWKAKPGDVALGWVLANPAVTAPIIGPRTLQQLNDAQGALTVKLDKKRLAELDKIFPGPGGAAPEA